MEKFVVQTVTQVEHIPQPDGSVRHRMIKAWSTIVGEPKAKKSAKKVLDVAIQSTEEQYL